RSHLHVAYVLCCPGELDRPHYGTTCPKPTCAKFSMTLNPANLPNSMPGTVSAELRDLLTLRLVPGLGPRLTAALLRQFGNATAVLHARPSHLQHVPHNS